MTTSSTPYAAEWLEMEEKMGGRSLLTGTVDDQRAQHNAMGAALSPLLPALPDTLDTKDVIIPDRLRVRVYRPMESAGNLPLGLYFHAGGLVMGSIESDDYFCRIVSMTVPSVIVSVEYRLAPENKYPAAQDDARKAFDWVFENAGKLGASPSKIYTIGQSAGANLALSLALHVKASSQPDRVNGVVALAPPTVSPSVIPAHLADSFKPADNTDSAIINATAMELYTSSYDPPLESPDFSVLLSTELGSLPPTYLVAFGKDPLRDDVLVLERELKKVNVKTKLDYYEGFPHLFWVVPGLRTGKIAVDNAIVGIQWVVGNI